MFVIYYFRSSLVTLFYLDLAQAAHCVEWSITDRHVSHSRNRHSSFLHTHTLTQSPLMTAVPFLTSSPGCMFFTARISADVPLYVTMTLGRQLWFINATLGRDRNKKERYKIKIPALISCNLKKQ